KYHTLKYESRAFDLDDLIGTDDFVLTGVKLRALGEHLNLEIQLTKFNFTTGKLNTDISYWESNDNTDGSDRNPRVHHQLSSRIPPTLSKNDFS
ncbi:hypothetical protein, partial [Salmonella sp. s58078]|uniref:hypothetical protein n=1 Tax=Salmonella sp. s58078 TaxID=3159699 RepID=UPI00397F6C8B